MVEKLYRYYDVIDVFFVYCTKAKAHKNDWYDSSD